MARKLAKRLKLTGNESEPSSPSVPLTSPDSRHDEGNQSEVRKKRKKMDRSDGRSGEILEEMACNLSEQKALPLLSGVQADFKSVTHKKSDIADLTNRNFENGNSFTNAESPVIVSNLELVRMLQDRKASRDRKIEAAHDFITNNLVEPNNIRRQVRMADSMAMPQFVSFLSEWVQSALLWSSKPQKLKKMPNIQEGVELHTLVPAHLDSRFWAVLRWCLSSGYLHKLASVSPRLMRALNLYVIAILEPVGLSEDPMEGQDHVPRPSLSEDAVRSIDVLLLANERSFRPDLDHWVSLTSTSLLKLTTLTHSTFSADEKPICPLHSLLVLILEGFGRLVAIHPNRRKIFSSLVENLLEPLLTAHACLRSFTNKLYGNFIGKLSSWHRRLLTAVEEILGKGLFDAAHVGSFQEVCTVLAGKDEVKIETKSNGKRGKRKFSSREIGEEEDANIHFSYHRLLFQKLHYFRIQGIELALMELGWMFETYSKRFRTHHAKGDNGVLGIKTKGNHHPSHATLNNGHIKDVEGDGSGKLVHNAQVFDKKDHSSEIVFSVFAEFVGPLMKDLKTLHLSLTSKEAGAITFEQILSAKVLFGAVTPLLKAAKTENAYVPTEDSSSRSNFVFLSECYNTVVGIGKTLPGVLGYYGPTRQTDDKELQAVHSLEHVDVCKIKGLLAEIFGEVISTIKYLMELEYRVAENSLGDVWAILFANVSFRWSSTQVQLPHGHILMNETQEAVNVACDMISIFSDLRQVNQVLFALCATLREFISQDSWLSFIDLEAVEFLACAKQLLSAVASAMHDLPEGQVAEFLTLLRVDASGSIVLMDVADSESSAVRVTVVLKGLVELYSSMLENVRITPTNSIQTGKAVQQFLTQIVSSKLGQLIDLFLSSDHATKEETKVGDISDKKLKKKMPAKVCDFGHLKKGDSSGKTNGAKSVLDTWICLFFLRMYTTSQSLQRECISLMPPKAAKKANAVFNSLDIDYCRCDVSDILTHVSSGSFFSSVGRGNVKVSQLLTGIGKSQDCQELVDLPPFLYSLDCIVVQSVAELTRHVEAISFLLVRSTEVLSVSPDDAESLGVGETVSADDMKPHVPQSLKKILKSLRHECQKLTKILLNGFFLSTDASQVFSLASLVSRSPGGKVNNSDSNGELRSRQATGNSLKDFSHQSLDSVEATLTADTLPTRKWHLLCKTFDVWSSYAHDGYLRKFLAFLFASTWVDQGMDSTSECPKVTQENSGEENYMKLISDNIFSNALFYEEESFRRMFATTFSDELEKSLVSAFGEWPFKSYKSMQEEMLSPVKEWSDYCKSVEGEISVDHEQDARGVSRVEWNEHSSSHAFKQLLFGLPEICLSRGHKRKTLSSASKKQGEFLVNSKLPGKQSGNQSITFVNPQLKALDLCGGLVHYLSLVPPGYIESSELTRCAYTILCFERLLVDNLLQLRATSRAAYHGSGSEELINFSIVNKLLKAFCSCRRALLALASSEGPEISSPPLLAIFAGSFASLHWLALSTQAVSTCLVDLSESCNFSKKEKEDVLSSGQDLLHKVLEVTASLMKFVSTESFRTVARRMWHQDNELVSEIMEENSEHPVCVSDDEKETNVVTALMVYQAERANQILHGRFTNDQISKHKASGSGEGNDSLSSVPCSLKIWYMGLVFSTSLCSYFWSLSNFLEHSIEKACLHRPQFMPIESKWHVQKLGHVLSGILLSAVLPVGSHAILLLGEHGVDRSMNSKHVKIDIIDHNQDEEPDSQLGNMVEREEEDDDEKYSISLVDVTRNKVYDEVDYEEEAGELEERRGEREGLDTDEIAKKDDFKKYDSVTELLDVEYTEKSKLQRSVLESMLQGCSRDQCDVIGELYLALAGVLRLESILRKGGHSSASCVEGSEFQDGVPPSVSILMGAAYFLLLKSAERTQPHEWSQLGWLIGVIKYMESMYYLLPYLKLPLPPLAFSRLFDMHLSMLGSLAPCEGSLYGYKLPNPLDLEDQQWISEGHGSTSRGLGMSNQEDKDASSIALRNAVRDSLGILLRSASRQHSVLALQSIMRALVGASEDPQNSSGLEICGLEGGRVGRSVGAGVECLSIALESVSGMKRLRLLANHFNEFFGAIFNLMEYLQGPHLFQKKYYRHPVGKISEMETDNKASGITVESGPVILQSLQILITTASRDSIFPMKPCHVALALHCPARIFAPVYHSGLSKHTIIQCFWGAKQLLPGKLQPTHMDVVRMETELGVRLYILSCRLLCSLIRHRRREIGHCIALLGDSARVLLQCLEAPNWLDQGETRDWSIKMVIYCASWLRRIYEEMGEHKDTLGKYCSHILADYLSVLAGHGPHAAGLMRDVESALQPGVYALVDACSTNDLQQLHASLGEGPRRNALLNLRRQHEQKFKYTGKV